MWLHITYWVRTRYVTYNDILFRGIWLSILSAFTHTHTYIYMVAYIIEPLACLDLRLDTTFKQEYSDATHATTLALFSSMKTQVSNLSMSLNSFWAIQFICKLTTLSTCWNKNSYQSIYVIYSHKVNKIQSNIKKTYMFSYYILLFSDLTQI